ncbi:hypothetical protein [Paraflavitalea pollutisoli]|uniref:hypothetical protein n=1 Tax=Paraflavitalea pollutisoli TaxID=3034143 RepID=UPI0023EB644C|nr:hypothetical protein [Paraflavitalea sp. H1-2-19X]
MLHLHNFLRWVILILLIVALFRHLSGKNNKRPVNAGDKKIDLFLMISAHLNFVVGLYLYFTRPMGFKLFQTVGSSVMSNSVLRFFAVEHMLGMLIAIVLITIGRGKVKRATDYTAHNKAFWFFLIALIIILASVPWPFRMEGIARPWFPGMTTN